MKILVALLASVLFFTACEFNQNPLAGERSEIQNGQAPETDLEPEVEPLGKDAFQIRVEPSDAFNVHIGTAVEFKISGQLMVDGIPSEITLLNMGDFPTATYNETTGQFRWVPQKSDLNGVYSRSFELRIQMKVIPSEAMPLSSLETKSVFINVVNDPAVPVVNNIELSGTVPAGNTVNGTVTIDDLDAGIPENVRVMVVDCPSQRTVSNWISFGRATSVSSAQGRYSIPVTLNLIQADALNSSSYCFGVVAISQFGKVSQSMQKFVSIEAKIKSTMASLTEIMQPVNTTKTYIFTVFDPLSTGVVTLLSAKDIASSYPGSSLTCKQGASRWQMTCELVLVSGPTPTPTGYVYNIDFTAQNASPTSNSIKVSSTHSIRVRIGAN